MTPKQATELAKSYEMFSKQRKKRVKEIPRYQIAHKRMMSAREIFFMFLTSAARNRKVLDPDPTGRTGGIVLACGLDERRFRQAWLRLANAVGETIP